MAIFTGKHKKRLQHRCILVNIANLLRTAIPKNICEQLLVCGVCVCVCVCLFTLFHREGVFRLEDIWDILGRCGSTMLYWVSFQVLLPSSFISISKNVIYNTTKDENSSEDKLDRKQYDIWFRKKIIYIDMRYKTAAQKTDKWRRQNKDEKATLI